MFKKIAAAVVLVAASSAAFAVEPPAVYVGVDASSTKIDGFDREGGYGAFIGYKFNESIAIEGGYHRLADTDYRIFGVDTNMTTDQLDLSVIGTLPLSNGFSIFGRLGYNRLEVEASNALRSAKDHDSGAVVGLGLAYTFTPEVSARLEFQRPASDVTKISAGLVYQF